MKRGAAPEPARPGADPLWYKDAIVYELHVRAFSDGDADGIGGFEGLPLDALLEVARGQESHFKELETDRRTDPVR